MALNWRLSGVTAVGCLAPLAMVIHATAIAAQQPLDLGSQNASTPGAPNYASAAVTLPDGTLESYYRRAVAGSIPIFRMRSIDSGRSWSPPEPLVNLSVESWGGPMPLLDQDGELHFVIPKVRGQGRKPNVDRFIDLYHLRSTDGRTKWTEPVRIYEGYCGALQGVFQLKSGRNVAPFAGQAHCAVPRRREPGELRCLRADVNRTSRWKSLDAHPHPGRLFVRILLKRWRGLVPRPAIEIS
jgi:hypothetical protein